MATFIVPVNTLINSDGTFGPLGVGDLEQVYGTAVNTTINGGEQDVYGLATLTTINADGTQYVFGTGTTHATTVNAGGVQYVEGGGTATGTNLVFGVQVPVPRSPRPSTAARRRFTAPPAIRTSTAASRTFSAPRRLRSFTATSRLLLAQRTPPPFTAVRKRSAHPARPVTPP